MKTIEVSSSEAKANQDNPCGLDKIMKDQSSLSEDSFRDAEELLEHGVYEDDTKDIKNKIHNANENCIGNDNNNEFIPR